MIYITGDLKDRKVVSITSPATSTNDPPEAEITLICITGMFHKNLVTMSCFIDSSSFKGWSNARYGGTSQKGMLWTSPEKGSLIFPSYPNIRFPRKSPPLEINLILA